ncbi:GvpL/GvpF family gas vesicle protein [Streptomyces sp. NPDC057621]|uniref:GvpL/GvpF family gas vesicle protein n=1 Tax=Streptomyces liliiviolaceus TaxID=2823109 RepID=A0A941B963_9ACTN|nr:GvpL/GvpF family gas vesicle protein [Streptomyces liliiviolaceus]MBQ0852356.1 GvpL/GvpF family gas vesicle protein [Streptomyces liliiviolaceus]
MSGLRYVYAVCRPFGTPLPAQLTGVAGVPPKQLVHGDLVAVVGQVPEEDFAEGPLRAHLEDLDWLGATARAHQNVIDALTGVTSPLPLRLATVFLDDSGVRSMLEERADTFRRTLGRLDGRVEWGVKVYSEPTEAPDSKDTSGKAASSPGRAAGSGRDYLRQRRNQRKESEEKWERAEEFSRRLHESLSGYAEDTRIHAPQNSALSRAPGRNILNAAYLVPRTESEAFVELVDRTKDDAPGLRVELTGPWAAYSFSGEDA